MKIKKNIAIGFVVILTIIAVKSGFASDEVSSLNLLSDATINHNFFLC